MEVRTNTTVQEFKGNGKLNGVVVKNLKTNEVEELNPATTFIFIGLDPNTAFVKDSIDLDQWGFIQTSPQFETNIPGVYAAGDVRAGSTKQVIGAVGKGTTAAMMIRHYLESATKQGVSGRLDQEFSPGTPSQSLVRAFLVLSTYCMIPAR
jgi:thioredoxin reductase (NADPH)